MFGWNSGNSSGSQYPGRRQPSSDSTPTATTIAGSIRPPPGDGDSGNSYTRQQHLDSYLKDDTLSRSTRKVSTDDTTYDTVFQTVQGATLILRVHFPPPVHATSPYVRPPAMSLAGVKARHEWLDSRMQVVGYPPIQSDQAWRQSHSLLLGTAVHQVIQKLQLEPPTILEITDKGLRSIQQKGWNNNANSSSASSGGSTGGANTSNRRNTTRVAGGGGGGNDDDAPPDYFATMTLGGSSSGSSAPPPPVVEMPKLPREFTELNKLSGDELDALLEDELEFMSFCNQLPVTKELQTKATKFIEDNATLAQSNLQHETKLQTLQEEVIALQKELTSKVEEFRTLEREQDRICAPPDTRKLVRELTKAKRVAFDESEAMAESWLDLDKDDASAQMDTFMTQFLEQRKIHHVRSAKLELLQCNP